MRKIDKIKAILELLEDGVLKEEEAMEKIKLVITLEEKEEGKTFYGPKEVNYSQIAKEAYARHHEKCSLCHINWAHKELENGKKVCGICDKKFHHSLNHSQRRKNLTAFEKNQILKYKQSGMAAVEIARKLNLHFSTVYNVIYRTLGYPSQKSKVKEQQLKIIEKEIGKDIGIEKEIGKDLQATQVYSRRMNGESFADIAHSLNLSNTDTRRLFARMKGIKHRENVSYRNKADELLTDAERAEKRWDEKRQRRSEGQRKRWAKRNYIM